MGEGACVLVLEELEHARARGAHIYCEVAGYGNTADAYHITSPAPDAAGITHAIRIAIEEARIDATEGIYINAHGTSTKLNDASETLGIKQALGEDAARTAPYLFDEIHDRAYARCNRRTRSGRVRSRDRGRRHPAHHRLLRARSRLRPGLLRPIHAITVPIRTALFDESRIRRAQRSAGIQGIRGLTMNIDSSKLNEVAALMENHGLTRVRLSEEDGRVIELERMTPSAPAPATTS